MAVVEHVVIPALNGAHETAGDTILDVHGLTVTYNGEPAVDNVSFRVERGERVAIIGPNGAGKSTLIQAALGLSQPQAGHVHLYADPQRVGYVPQHEGVNWEFPVTVRDVVMMGRTRMMRWWKLPGRRDWRDVDEALERVDLLEFRDRQVGELSGGQRRRVFIARALAQQAELLILDEPFSGVDVQAQAGLMDVLDRLNAGGLTLLLSTHDLDLAFRRFDKVLALRRALVAYGAPEAVYTPDVLSQMYGSKLTFSADGERVSVYVDDHHCPAC